jgi:Ca2+-binding EF-hand superfamily protein
MINAISGNNAAATYGTGGASRASKYIDQIFSKLDANGDGSFDKTELTSFVQGAQAAGDTSVDVDKIFSALDANGDGSVTKQEFGDASRKLHDQLQSQSRSDKLFAKIDTNGDGTIGSDELSSFISSLPASADGGPSKLADILKQADTNGDGSISKTELSTAIQNQAQTQKSTQTQSGAVHGHHHHHHGGGHHAAAAASSTDTSETLDSSQDSPDDQAILNFLKQYQQAGSGFAPAPTGSLVNAAA